MNVEVLFMDMGGSSHWWGAKIWTHYKMRYRWYSALTEPVSLKKLEISFVFGDRFLKKHERC